MEEAEKQKLKEKKDYYLQRKTEIQRRMVVRKRILSMMLGED